MDSPRQTHPLMPGVRSAEINQTDWPRTLHDKQLTGFSPLCLNMTDAPEVWQSIDVPGAYHWIRAVDVPTGPAFLVDDGRLALYDVASPGISSSGVICLAMDELSPSCAGRIGYGSSMALLERFAGSRPMIHPTSICVSASAPSCQAHPAYRRLSSSNTATRVGCSHSKAMVRCVRRGGTR